MRCYYCGAELDDTSICPVCGEDVSVWKKICATSNLLYNDGLEKAQVRNLSGAVESLKRSLRFNKANVPARNLLGLIYYETGDSVAALSEWVISKSMDYDDNPASDYISKVQKDAAKLSEVDSSLKKFNQSLELCREGSDDLAMINLKKVVSMNPKLVKGYQLLALLYMKQERYDQALQNLRQAARIDAGSSMTQRYIKFCRENLRGSRRRKPKQQENEDIVTYQSANDLIIRPTKITDNSTVRTVLNLLIGAAIGIAFVCFLILPEVRQRANTRAAAQIVETDQSLAVREQTIETMQAEMDSLNQQMKDAADATESAGERTLTYQALLNAYQYFMEYDYTMADLALTDVNRSLLETDGQELYDSMQEIMESSALENAYETGMELYNARNYDEAVTKFLSIVDAHPDYEEGQAAYYLAYSYNYLGDYENAIKWFNVTLETATDPTILETSQNMVDSLMAEGYSPAD